MQGQKSAPASPSPAEVNEYPSPRRAIFTLVILVLAYLVSFVDRQALSLMVNPIKADLGISDFQMSLLQGFAFALFFCLLGIPLGRMADRYSRRIIIAAGILFWSIMTVLCGLANSYFLLFIFRMGVGIGEAALAPAAYSMLADSFRKDRLVWATSIFALGAMLGGGLAFLVGGYVMDYAANATELPFGLSGLAAWQFTFIAVGLPGVLVAALVLLIREPKRHGVANTQPLALGEAFAYLWSRRRDYAPFYFAAMMMAVLSYGGLTWFPTHMIRTFGLTPGEVGLILGIVHLVGPTLGTLLGAGMTQWFMKRGHTDASLRTVMIVAAVAGTTYIAPLMPTLELTTGVWLFSLFFQTAYYGNVLATLQTITPNRLRATNSAMLTLVVSLGGLGLGSALIGAIADIFFLDNPRGIGIAMVIVGVSCGWCASVIAARGRQRLRTLEAEGVA